MSKTWNDTMKELGLDNLENPPEEVKVEEQNLAPLTPAEKKKALKSVVKSLNKSCSNTVQIMGKRVGQRLPAYPTNLISFDEEIGCGGLPKGRIIEIFGPESSGKTTLALHFIAEVQKAGGNALFVDAEHALDPSYASRIGVNMDDLLVSQPDCGEQALEVVEAMASSRSIDIIVVDSVSALVPRAELDGDMGDSHMGLQARLMSQAMRKLVGLCAKNGVTVVFINQIREKLGEMFGNPETTTGGRALKFYASLRIKIRQLSKTDGGIITEEEGKKRIGQRCRLVAVKNKAGGAPYAETDLNLLYASGWDKSEDLFEYALKIGAIREESKGWYMFDGQKVRKSHLTDPATFDILKTVVLKTIEDKREADAKKAEDKV